MRTASCAAFARSENWGFLPSVSNCILPFSSRSNSKRYLSSGCMVLTKHQGSESGFLKRCGIQGPVLPFMIWRALGMLLLVSGPYTLLPSARDHTSQCVYTRLRPEDLCDFGLCPLSKLSEVPAALVSVLVSELIQAELAQTILLSQISVKQLSVTQTKYAQFPGCLRMPPLVHR